MTVTLLKRLVLPRITLHPKCIFEKYGKLSSNLMRTKSADFYESLKIR